MAVLNINPYKHKKSTSTMTQFHTALLPLLILACTAMLLFHCRPTISPPCSNSSLTINPKFSGDLREVEFSWNHLLFSDDRPPPATLKIAVFSRKWPIASAPGGMERHALTLHSALARRGHRVHVFTAAPPPNEVPRSREQIEGKQGIYPKIHFIDGSPGQWKCDVAWKLFEAESLTEPFDVVHSESVALFHRYARKVPNLVVTWHGIAFEALQSGIYQDLARDPSEPISPVLNQSLAQAIYKVLDEIRFFQSYAHHVAISDSMGEMLRDVYQIPRGRSHVILNGVDEEQYKPDSNLGAEFRKEIDVPANARVVLGVAGRLVKDKGHPLLHQAFSKFVSDNPEVYLVIAGSGPWMQRYVDLGPNVIVLGPLAPEKLRAFYNALDVFVNPTLRPQGLDLTLMEAMQCGKPVAATRFPSIKGSVVVDGEFGFTFAPNADALLQALEDILRDSPERLAERGRKAREYAGAMFGARKMAMAYERLFLCVKNERFCHYPSEFDFY